MNDFEDDATKDDLDVEVTDLEPIERTSRISRMLMAWEGRPSVRLRAWRIALTSGSLMLVVLVIFGTFPSSREIASGIFSRLTSDHPTEPVKVTVTPGTRYVFNEREVSVWTADTSSAITPSATLGSAPQDCPEVSQTHYFHVPGFPMVAGHSPILVIGLGELTVTLTHFKHAQPPEIGWYRPITLLTEINYAGTVTLQGGEVNGSAPIWFGVRQHDQGLITSLSVRPVDASVSHHFGDDQQWGLLHAIMYIPRAGCYVLIARWPEGRWIVFFAAGR